MSDFLYPFIDGDERGATALLDDLTRSARDKTAASTALRVTTLAALADDLDAAASQIAQRFADGGRLFTFGNGGSATDAAATAALFGGRCLAADPAVLTALANDVGFDLVFSRQLISTANAGDIAFGLSTSGGSANVLRAFEQARRIGMLTVGVAGYDGGAMAQAGTVDICLVVRADSVHRIQETQAAVVFELWRRTQELA